MNQTEEIHGRGVGMGYEELLTEVSARFINVTIEDLDGAIEQAQRVVCERLGLDRSSLFQQCGNEPDKFLLTHVYQSEAAGGPIIERSIGTGSGSRRIGVL